MGVHKTVFGSAKEKSCFKKLNSTWSGNYNIYHNLPYLSVFTAKDELINDALEPFSITDDEFDKLKKTSIDFVICDLKTDQPLVCIEFDGMQDGFNIGTDYHLKDGSEGRKGRRYMTELKLKVAHGSQFPFFILGSDEFKGLSDSIRLTIADGLIGEVLSMRAFHRQLDKGFNPREYGFTTEEFEALPEEKRSGFIDDWLISAEVESDYKHNPIFKTTSNLSSKLNVREFGTTFLNNEQLDSDMWVVIQSFVTNQSGTETAEIRLPNFQTPYCYFSVHVAVEIGKLVALEKLKKCQQEHGAYRDNAR